VSLSLVYKLTKAGHLAVVRIGNRRLIPRADVQRYLHEHHHAAANEDQVVTDIVSLAEHRD
jgi:excisionase family DNA binding protein